MNASLGVYKGMLLGCYRRYRAMLMTFAIAAGIVFAIGIFVTASTRPQFEASAIITPQKQVNESSSSTATSGLSGALGSIFQSDTSENLTAFQQLMSTAELANTLIKNERFMQIAFPSRRVHRSLINRLVRSAFGRETPDTIQPSDVENFVTGSFYTQKLTAPNYIDISYSNVDRQAAITELRIFLATSDDILKGRERASLATQIKYLSNTIRGSADVTQLEIFRQMLEQKLSSELLLDTQPTYSFRMFDVPDAPAIQTSPNLSIMLAIVIFASLIAGCLAVVARALFAERLRTMIAEHLRALMEEHSRARE